jgi:hypothetical protein
MLAGPDGDEASHKVLLTKLSAYLTCPHCGRRRTETVPTDASCFCMTARAAARSLGRSGVTVACSAPMATCRVLRSRSRGAAATRHWRKKAPFAEQSPRASVAKSVTLHETLPSGFASPRGIRNTDVDQSRLLRGRAERPHGDALRRFAMTSAAGGMMSHCSNGARPVPRGAISGIAGA